MVACKLDTAPKTCGLFGWLVFMWSLAAQTSWHIWYFPSRKHLELDKIAVSDTPFKFHLAFLEM